MLQESLQSWAELEGEVAARISRRPRSRASPESSAARSSPEPAARSPRVAGLAGCGLELSRDIVVRAHGRRGPVPGPSVRMVGSAWASAACTARRSASIAAWRSPTHERVAEPNLAASRSTSPRRRSPPSAGRVGRPTHRRGGREHLVDVRGVVQRGDQELLFVPAGARPGVRRTPLQAVGERKELGQRSDPGGCSAASAAGTRRARAGSPPLLARDDRVRTATGGRDVVEQLTRGEVVESVEAQLRQPGSARGPRCPTDRDQQRDRVVPSRRATKARTSPVPLSSHWASSASATSPASAAASVRRSASRGPPGTGPVRRIDDAERGTSASRCGGGRSVDTARRPRSWRSRRTGGASRAARPSPRGPASRAPSRSLHVDQERGLPDPGRPGQISWPPPFRHQLREECYLDLPADHREESNMGDVRSCSASDRASTGFVSGAPIRSGGRRDGASCGSPAAERHQHVPRDRGRSCS